MKEQTITKIIQFMSTPSAQVVQDIVDKTGKTSVLGGGIVYTVDKIMPGAFSLPDIAIIVSIAGGVMWIIKLLVDIIISCLKYSRGDKE